MRSQVVSGKQVLTPVIREITQDGMDVVGPILCFVILDEEGGPLDRVVVRLARFGSARPGKADGFQASLLDSLLCDDEDEAL